MPELWCSDTIKRILSNPHYTGCTVNFRTTKKSYKCKKKVWNDPSKWVTFENTQEAIIDKQTYDTVQKIREGRRRPTPMGEMNVFSGMVYLAQGAGAEKEQTQKHRNRKKEFVFGFGLLCGLRKENVSLPLLCHEAKGIF